MGSVRVVMELAERLSGRCIIDASLTDDDVKGKDLESLTAHIISFFEGREGLKILDKGTLGEILKEEGEEKKPVQIEITRPLEYMPLAKEVSGKFSVRNVDVEKTSASVSDFASYFNDRFDKLRNILESGRTGNISMLSSIDKIGQYATGRELSIVGMVYEKMITKKGNLMVTIEDDTGSVKVIFTKPQGNVKGGAAADTFSAAMKLVSDQVVAVKGKIATPFIIANKVLWPDIPIRTRKVTENDTAIAFTSDVHVGSKLFLDKQFSRFLEWINGRVERKRDLAGKIKYLVISGDLVDGIGVYPEQDKELTIPDIYKQYSMLFDLLSKVPDYLEIFVLTGNHDAVQRSEPQPMLTREIIGDFSKENVHFVSNPGYVMLDGLRVLAYHGTSLDSVIWNVPGCSYSRPESAMIEVLKMRHISPIYGDNPVTPGKSDSLVIDQIPDILHMGHLHRNGYADYHGTQIVNSGTWQARTSYQIKLGHMPTPAVLPVYESKQGRMGAVDFNTLGV